MNRALLVEGRADLAALLEGMLQELDLEVVVAATLNAAIKQAHGTDVCLALLEENIGEANVGSVKSYPVADILAERGIPFAFINSQGRSGLDRAYWRAPVLVKPFNRQQLREIISFLKPCER